MNLLQRVGKLFSLSTVVFDKLSPVGHLSIRCYVSYIFFKAGLAKIQSLSTTVMLFKYEYQVPLLNPKVAAVLSTTTELLLPVFLILGLGARVPAFLLLLYNAMAVYAYPYLLSHAGSCALKDHILWGCLIAILCLEGPGKLSLDYLLVRKRT